MSRIDEDLKMQKITRLLEKGGTMLAQSHECGAPMFRFQGKVMCPVCDSGTGDQRKADEEAVISKKQLRKDSLPEAHPGMREEHGDIGQVALIIRKTIQDIAESLESETDLNRIKEKLECVEIGVRILKSLE